MANSFMVKHMGRGWRWLAGILILLTAMPLSAQEESSQGDLAWKAQLEDLETREDVSPVDRLSAKSAVLTEAISTNAAPDEALQEWISEVLQDWESSSELETARSAYLLILETLCRQLSAVDAPISLEGELRIYLQRALTLARSPMEEGRFQFYLAESWLRSAPTDPASYRRAESLLQGAASELGPNKPAPAVHLRLGQLYQDLGGEAPSASNTPYLSRAAWHFERVRNFPESDPEQVRTAESALQLLNKPELVFEVAHRYLPESDIRLRIATRNLESVKATVFPIPSGLNPALSLDALESALSETEPLPEAIRLTDEISVAGRTPQDWNRAELALGEAYSSGWYGVRLESGDIVHNRLLLVTRLEVAGWTSGNGRLRLWVTDIDAGLPVANAVVTVFDSEGRKLVTDMTGEDGALIVDGEATGNWQEIHVISGLDAAILQKPDMEPDKGHNPWILTSPSELIPGSIFEWSIVAAESTGMSIVDALPHFIFPDNRLIEMEPANFGLTWASGSLVIPEDMEQGGPVYARMKDGHRILVAHLRHQQSWPLDIEIIGEEIEPGYNLFTTASSINIELSAVLGQSEAIPDFVRLRLSSIQRPAFEPAGAAVPGEAPRVIQEMVYPVAELQQGSLQIEWPDLSLPPGITPMRIQALPLDADSPLGEAWFGMATFRSTVRFDVAERIIRPDDELAVSFDFADPAAGGELVVFRETWESRYIHRKRGTTISETEYLALPDRALLGSAKTDYRLSEEGFVRDEVERLPLAGGKGPDEVKISLQQPGYYKLEFVGRGGSVFPLYPEDGLEVWVVPEGGDLQGFRSEETRLIVDRNADDSIDVLVLSDRTDNVGLIDCEYSDGSSSTIVRQFDDAALLARIPVNSGAPPVLCRVLVVGDRESDLLWQPVIEQQDTERWELQTRNLFGLNPGVPFDWELIATDQPITGPVLWTMTPGSANPLSEERLDWQRELRRIHEQSQQAGVQILNRQLPLWSPFNRTGREGSMENSDQSLAIREPATYLRIFPEAKRFADPVIDAVPFLPVARAAGPQRTLARGILPNSAGQWNFSVMSLDESDGLVVDSWLLSTELPIRSAIDGPPELRLGDSAQLTLSLENTTRNPANLLLQYSSGDRIVVEADGTGTVALMPSGQQQVDAVITAVEGGVESVDVSVMNGDSVSEAVLPVGIVTPVKQRSFRFAEVDPDRTGTPVPLDLAGWESGLLLASHQPGGLLPLLWREMRNGSDLADPLYAALGDWAIWRVFREDPLGMEADPAARLASLLAEFQGEAGGWGWIAGGESDPWLSALITWSLELFKAEDTPQLGRFLPEAVEYLEGILANPSLDTETRLFGLRALALPAFYDADRGPSRIQARIFLEYLHRLPELSYVETAFLLQVAKAYSFGDEITLLEGDLERRLTVDATVGGKGFWEASIHYLVSGNTGSSPKESAQDLNTAMNSLSELRPGQGWNQLGGFLNLLAGYFWKGQPVEEGELTVRLAGQDAAPLPERVSPGSVLLSLDDALRESSKVEVLVEGTGGSGPVLLAASGVLGQPVVPEALPGVDARFQREFLEETLFNGMRPRFEEIASGNPRIENGDTIRATISFELDEDHPYAILHIPVPAGLNPRPESILFQEISGPSDLQGDAVMLEVVRDDPENLERRLRYAPLRKGTYQIVLSYESLWSGTFSWPSVLLELPVTGTVYRLTDSRMLSVEDAR